MIGESELKILHDEVRYFANNKMAMSFKGISSDLEGWPELMHAIAAGTPEQITFDQLRALVRFTDTIIDLTHKNLGLPPMLISEYRDAHIKEKAFTAMQKHPENKAYSLLRNFYATQAVPMLDAMHAVTALDPFGEGYERSNTAINNFRTFIEAVEALDPHFKSGMKPAEYAPDLVKCMAELGIPSSPLRNTGFEGAINLCKNLDVTLGLLWRNHRRRLQPHLVTMGWLYNVQMCNGIWLRRKYAILRQRAPVNHED